ncbi:restin homolog isoform X3 [Patella vulgata]|uniref:restin homolog isoform X3 n=1 Tax=Patella vulgata TaxID=6465 RepID=UPI0024A9744C|nr:restin homolog isoform X3 [Patella vulgata]
MTSQYTSKIPGPGKKRSFLPAPVKAAPRPRSPSPEPESDNPFQIGERVCIGGIKFGTLQYFGETHIATGVWCGVELDEPEGNHDGMVQGHRYFTCEDKHGIFAPVDKVAILEEDIYFEDDYVDTSSEIEEPVITPRKHRQQTESKIVRSRHSQDVISTTKDREPRYQYKSQSGRGSGIRKHGSPDKQIKQTSVSASTSNETLSSQTSSPVRSRSGNRGEYSRKDVDIVNKPSADGDDVKKQHKPSHIPGISGISRLPKYSSNSSIIKSSSSSEQIKSAITSPITSPLSPEYEKIDDELCATYTLDSESDNISKGVRVTPEETYSNGISVQLKSDSRQYLNLTFDPETGYAGKNLPDVVASNSPSPEGKEYNRAAYREGGDNSNNTTIDSNCSEILEASRLDDVNLLDINLLGCADEKQKRESLSALSCQFDKLKLSTTPIENRNRQIVNLNDTYTMASHGGESDNYSNSANVTQDMKSSQQLSMDQPVNIDDQKKLIDLETSEQISRCNIDKLETEMDKSLDDASRKLMMDSGISEMSSSQMTDSMSMTRSHQMENIHACLVRSDMIKSVTDNDRKLMTDSGISERGNNRDVNVGFVTSDVTLGEDLKSGHNKLERPVSLISTTSVDTGYVPDTDSECGTKTTNSPEWPERLGDHTSMTESQIIQYQDSFQEVKHIISAQISVDSDVSGTTHDTETDHETDASDPTNINSSTLKIDIAPELRSNSSHNSEDDRIEADQVIDDVDGVSGDKTLQTSTTSQDTNSPSTENSCDVVSVVDKTENEKESTDNMADNADDGTENCKVSSAKTSPKHAAKTDHKKPNVKVTSRLADYINAPAPPPKPKDDAQNKKNFIKINLDKNKSTDKNVANIQKTESTKKVKVEKEPPKLIKRTPPKSKWGSIMSQIDAHKDDKPPAVKTEVKSKLQEYLSTPAPTPVRKEKPPKKETKPRSVIMHAPKPDYSKVKSRLSVMTATPKADATASSRRGSKVDKKIEGSLQGSGVNSTRSSRTDVSSEVNNHGNHNNRTPRSSISTPLTKLAAESRRSSVSSIKSDKSQGSVKVSNNKNIKKPDDKSLATPNNKRTVKSTIPPVVRTPKKVLPKVNEKSIKKDNSRKPSLIKTPKASNQNRNRTLQNTPGRSAGYGKPTTKEQSGSVSNSFRSTSSKEVTRLESLCEVRTKELNMVKIELKSTTQALDAMTCLIKYLTQELDAFSCPQKTADLKEAQELQKQAQEQIVELQKQKTELEEKLSEITKQHEETLSELTKLQNEMVSEKETHETTVKELKEQHEKSMALQKEKVETENAKENAKLKENHEKMHHFMKVQSEREIADMKFESQSRLDMLRVKHLEEIQELRNKHDIQMEELHKQHRDKLEDITHRFECIKCSLGDKVETLRRECDELKYRAKQSEEALFRDTDVKVQMALAPYRHLPEEVESLKTVVEMRNEEIMKLRKVNMDLEKQLDELPIAREKIISLQQKIENLDAIVNIKSGHEKQLHDKVQILMTKYAKESKANKRLSMDYEELMYKLAASPDVMTASQESLFKRQISRSPPGSECSSPDLRRKTRSPFDNDDQSPSRRSGRANGDRKSATDDTLERKINRRSQTFVVDKKNSNSSSPNRHLSPNKNGQDSPMSRSLELSDGNQSQLSGVGSELPPSDSTDNELSVSLNELGVAALEDSLVSINSNSPCLSDSEVFESPQKQKRNIVEEDDGAVKVETDV